jgi:hypothetical protein
VLLHLQSLLFADDTSIGYIAQDESTLRNMINTDLNHLKKWSNRWLLKFNPTKTEIIIFNVNGVECNICPQLSHTSDAYSNTGLIIIMLSNFFLSNFC